MQPPPPIPTTGRPKVLSAAAIICFIFGAFGLLGIVGVAMAIFGSPIASLDPVSGEMMSDPGIRRFQITSGILGTLGGAVLVAAGVGLLRCKNWARVTVLAWGVFHLLNAFYAAYMTVYYVLPATQKALAAQMKAQGGPGSDVAVQIGSAAGMIGAAMGILFAIAVVVALIILVTRPQAKAACRRSQA
jgi:hypothetical protein